MPTDETYNTWKQYSDADRDKIKEIRGWLTRGRRSLRYLADKSGIPYSKLQKTLVGAIANPTPLLEEAISFIESQRSGLPVAPTSITKLVERICDEASNLCNDDAIGVIYGFVGVGKTTALQSYVRRYPHAIYIRAFKSMPATTLLDRLVRETGAQVSRQNQWGRGTNADKLDAVVAALDGANRLIIIDEATRMHKSCLEIVRDIADDAGAGLVLAAREMLLPLLQDEQGQFGEIASRIFFWPPVLEHIREEDSRSIVEHACGGAGAVGEDVIEMFWQCADGNARRLGQLIMRTKQYCKKKKTEITAEIVSNANQRALSRHHRS